MALLEQQSTVSKGPSLAIQLVLLLGITALAAGAAWFAGSYLEHLATGAQETAVARSTGHASPQSAPAHGPSNVVDLKPITTNMAEPSEVWMRAELSLVFTGPVDTAVAEAIHQDLFAYLRTLKLRQVETPSGFQHLKSDLEERARIRSGGTVDKILFRALLFE